VLYLTYNLPNTSQIQQTYTFYFVSPTDVYFMIADTVNTNPPRLGGELILQDPTVTFDDTALNGTSVVTGSGLDTNASVFVGALTGTAATDAVYVMFTSAVVARKRVPAATWSSVWYLLSSYAVISYTENWIYVAFAALGSWFGAFASITFLHRPPGGPPIGAAPE